MIGSSCTPRRSGKCSSGILQVPKPPGGATRSHAIADLGPVLPVGYVPRRTPSRKWEVRRLAPLRGAGRDGVLPTSVRAYVSARTPPAELARGRRSRGCASLRLVAWAPARSPNCTFLTGGVCRRTRSWMFFPVGPGIAARQRSEPHDLYFPYGARSAWSGRIAIGCKRGFLIGIPCRKSFCDNLVFLSREIAFQRQSDNLIGIPRRKSFCDNSAFLSRENVLQRPSHHLVETPSRSPFSHGTRNRVAIP